MSIFSSIKTTLRCLEAQGMKPVASAQPSVLPCFNKPFTPGNLTRCGSRGQSICIDLGRPGGPRILPKCFGRALDKVTGGIANYANNADRAMDAQKDKFGGRAEFDKLEGAVDQLRAAASQLADKPYCADARKAFSEAAANYKSAVDGLAGEMAPQDLAPMMTNADKLMLASKGLESAGPNTRASTRYAMKAFQAMREISRDVKDLPLRDNAVTDPNVLRSAEKLEAAVVEMDQMADKLKDKMTGMPEFSGLEAAIDEYRAAVEQLKKNPGDARAKTALAAASEKMLKAVDAMKGAMDPGAHNALRHQVSKLDEASDKIAKTNRYTYAGDLSKYFDEAASASAEVTDNLENLLNPTPDPSSKTWEVDKANRKITLDNGYTIELSNNKQQWTLKDKDGNVTRVWGDPHVDEDGDGDTDWDFKRDSTFVLEDGTKISVETAPWKGGDMTVSSKLTITKGDQAVVVSGIDKNQVQISDVMLNGRELDASTNDGFIFREGAGGVDEWMNADGKEIRENQAMGNEEFVNEIGDQTKQPEIEIVPRTYGAPLYTTGVDTRAYTDRDMTRSTTGRDGSPSFSGDQVEFMMRIMMQKLEEQMRATRMNDV
ncbi:MAG TPA: hypothetical protein DD979_04420 [Gammaproteobacteria bacterium]|nr:hypothetical protein [Gammaproteobacteria bacterium]